MELMELTSRSWARAVLAVAIALILGVIDWYTGYELNFFVFYFLPVYLVAWHFGVPGATAISLISASIWFAADHLTEHNYTSHIFVVWNTMIRLISFLAIGFATARLKYLFDKERETAEILRRSLSEIKVLESFLPICAQCKKIRDEQGTWYPLEVYISEHSNTQFSHGYCPDCYRKALADAGLLGK